MHIMFLRILFFSAAERWHDMMSNGGWGFWRESTSISCPIQPPSHIIFCFTHLPSFSMPSACRHGHMGHLVGERGGGCGVVWNTTVHEPHGCSASLLACLVLLDPSAAMTMVRWLGLGCGVGVWEREWGNHNDTHFRC